jgi:serine/threonine protein kinase
VERLLINVIEYKDVEVARKTIGSNLVARNKFLQETETLYILKTIRHRNIVPILGAYYQHKQLNILFPLAVSDLEHLLTNPKPTWLDKTIDVLKAMCGLGDGLNHIHNFQTRVLNNTEIKLHGAHQDLKPQNVLIMNQQLVIADFGLCQMKPFDQNSKTKWKESTVDYGPPEARDPLTWETKEIGRAFDIWSLAALFMELMIYDRKGNEGIREFRRDRTFTDTYGETRCFHKDGKLHDSVSRWLILLKDHAIDTNVIKLIELIESMFEINHDARPGSKRVVDALRRIIIGNIGEHILSVLEEAVQGPQAAEMGNILFTKLVMEKTRLKAWTAIASGSLEPYIGDYAYHQHNGDYASTLRSLEECRDFLIQWQEEILSRNKFSKLFGTLSSTNDELYESQQENAKALIDDVFVIFSATAQSTSSQQAMHKLATHTTLFPRYSDAPLIALSRYMAQILAGHVSTDPGLPSRPLSEALLEKNQGNSKPSTYWYHIGHGEQPEVKALVEWRNYGRKWTEDDKEEAQRIGRILLQRVAILANMLQRAKQSEFRVLDCLGFVHKPEIGAFGLVFRIPCQDASPVTLHALFGGQKEKRQQPTLTQKFSLAKILARSLHKLHISNWMHKCFWSDNVIFFTSMQDPLTLTTVNDPYIRGFEYSRPIGFNEYSEKPDYDAEEKRYQHPEYFGDPRRPYQNAYDYYSLGLVLLEIALWRPLNRIHKDFSNAVEAKEFYVGYCKEYVAQSMGELYADATISCLGDQFWQSDLGNVDSERDHHLTFQREVVKRLELCKA